MKVNIKFTNKKAALPFKKHNSDLCYDLYATSKKDLGNGYYEYGTGISLQLVGGVDSLNYGFEIKPRSSVWKTGMRLTNCTGVIDRDYTGEIKAVFFDECSELPNYEIGDRICQISLVCTKPLCFEVVDKLEETERGSGGYGSTGR